MGLLNWFRDLLRLPDKRSTASVRFDDLSISCRRSEGDVKEVAWGDLVAVEIRTTDAGPFVEDVFLVLHCDGIDSVIPQEAHGFSELLNRLQQLPGFDNKAVISAMTCTDNAVFPCWQRAAH